MRLAVVTSNQVVSTAASNEAGSDHFKLNWQNGQFLIRAGSAEYFRKGWQHWSLPIRPAALADYNTINRNF
jgi:hypothetical protein